MINGAIGSHIQEFCVKNKISKDAFVLGVFHRTLRAYSHEAFAIGVYQEGGNILLVPFEGKRNGGTESLQALNGRWTNDILPYTKTSYDEVKKMGYGCLYQSIARVFQTKTSLPTPISTYLSIGWNAAAEMEASKYPLRVALDPGPASKIDSNTLSVKS